MKAIPGRCGFNDSTYRLSVTHCHCRENESQFDANPEQTFSFSAQQYVLLSKETPAGQTLTTSYNFIAFCCREAHLITNFTPHKSKSFLPMLGLDD